MLPDTARQGAACPRRGPIPPAGHGFRAFATTTSFSPTGGFGRDDVAVVVALVTRHPALLVENTTRPDGNWGPPMSYAANLGRDAIVEALRGLGATDLEHAFARA